MRNQIRTLLVAEDDDDDFLFFKHALESHEFAAEIRRVCDGVEAIEYLGGEGQYAEREAYPSPDLMVADLKMPRKGGFEVLRWLRNHRDLRSLPVVIFSSSNAAEDITDAYNEGANSYLVKPLGAKGYAEIVRMLRN